MTNAIKDYPLHCVINMKKKEYERVNELSCYWNHFYLYTITVPRLCISIHCSQSCIVGDDSHRNISLQPQMYNSGKGKRIFQSRQFHLVHVTNVWQYCRNYSHIYIPKDCKKHFQYNSMLHFRLLLLQTCQVYIYIIKKVCG